MKRLIILLALALNGCAQPQAQTAKPKPSGDVTARLERIESAILKLNQDREMYFQDRLALDQCHDECNSAYERKKWDQMDERERDEVQGCHDKCSSRYKRASVMGGEC